MADKKRGRPAKMSIKNLVKEGYQLKLDHLTAEEADEWNNGKKITVKGKPARGDRPDFLYYFKIIDGVEVKIHKVGPDLYWNSAKLTFMWQLPKVEEGSIANAKWEKMDAQVKDTKPPEPTLGKIVEERPSRFPHVITLKGGPFDGQTRPYNTMFPFFMEQKAVSETVTCAYQYRRDKEDKTIYHYHQTL